MPPRRTDVDVMTPQPQCAWGSNNGEHREDARSSAAMLAVVAMLVAVVSAVATVVTPPAPAAASGLTSVSAGAYHTCAITPDGTVACCGDNSNGQGSTSFTLEVTVDGLCNRTEQYANNSRTAASLTTPLGLVMLAEQMHNPRMKAPAINSYILLVNTQRGRGLTAQRSDTLIRLARAL